MGKNSYIRKVDRLNQKIEEKRSLSNNEIAQYFGIEEKIVKNIFLMYESFGRDSVISITLTDDEIDEIIKFRYPTISTSRTTSSNNSTDILEFKIEQLLLPTRVEKILKKHYIHTLEDFKKYTLKDIYLFRNMGKSGLKSIIKAIKDNGKNPYKVFKSMVNYMIEYPQRIDLREIIEVDYTDQE